MPEGVVHGGVRPVERDAHPPDAAGDDLAGHRLVNHRRVRGQGHGQSRLCGIAGDVEDVGPEEGLAAGEDKDRPANSDDVVN